ncbi:MAG: GTP-binding protein, partial [Clostridia bacterium]|nr:GTP-binding protein [Clostridia bacterium]
DIFSGFLGAGKTTLIKKLVKEAYGKEKIVIIENEFGEIGIDGKFLSDAGIEITEMNSGCICCSLVGDFKEALKKVLDDFAPDRIIIEPSGVGKLSDVIKSVMGINDSSIQLNCVTAVVDAQKCKMYTKNFGEFFNDQIKSAKSVVLSRTGKMKNDKINETVDIIKNLNPDALIITTDWEILDGKKILQAIETGFNAKDLMKDEECPVCHHHHDHDEHCHHDHDEHCHHDHDEHCHHDHDEHCHHDHDEHCHHDHDEHHHHHHHHADDVFTSWGKETAKKYSKDFIEKCLSELEDAEKFGTVLRAKGVVEGEDGWVYFDYVPGEADVRNGEADVTGRLCVIGSKLNEEALCELFEI